MKLSLLGSTGFLGKFLLKKLLDDGFQIKTLVRNPDRLGDYKNKVEFIQGNVFNIDDIDKVVSGTEVLISTIGPPPGFHGNPEIYKKAMENIVSVLQRKNIMRFIHIGGAVHQGGKNENWTIKRRLLRFFLNLYAKPVLEAKYLEWEVLKKSKLDWTLIRPPRITDSYKKRKEIKADEYNLARIQVNVENLASFILEQVKSDVWVKKAPLVS